MSIFAKFYSLGTRLNLLKEAVTKNVGMVLIDPTSEASTDSIDQDPFPTFDEWDSDADRRAYARLGC